MLVLAVRTVPCARNLVQLRGAQALLVGAVHAPLLVNLPLGRELELVPGAVGQVLVEREGLALLQDPRVDAKTTSDCEDGDLSLSLIVAGDRKLPSHAVF